MVTSTVMILVSSLSTVMHTHMLSPRFGNTDGLKHNKPLNLYFSHACLTLKKHRLRFKCGRKILGEVVARMATAVLGLYVRFLVFTLVNLLLL